MSQKTILSIERVPLDEKSSNLEKPKRKCPSTSPLKAPNLSDENRQEMVIPHDDIENL